MQGPSGLALGVLLAAFVLGLVRTRPFIYGLRRFRMGKQIRREGPRSHYAKQGLLTMGGLLQPHLTTERDANNAGQWLLVDVVSVDSVM